MKFGAKFSTCTIKCFEDFDERSFNIQSLSVELVPDCHSSEILFTFANLSAVKHRGTTRHCSGRYDSRYFITRKWWFVLFSDVKVLCRLFWICLSTVAWDPECIWRCDIFINYNLSLFRKFMQLSLASFQWYNSIRSIKAAVLIFV